MPSPPCAWWKSRSCSKGYEQITSELRTKNGESSFARTSRASARGPAVLSQYQKAKTDEKQVGVSASVKDATRLSHVEYAIATTHQFLMAQTRRRR